MEADAPTTTPTHSDDCECGPCNDAENAKAMPTTTPTPDDELRAVTKAVELSNGATMHVTTWERPSKPKPQPSAEALEPANQILDAMMARWKYDVENDERSFGDITCLADDLLWGDDVVDDYVHDLVYLGYAAVLPDGTFAPTEKGAQHHASIG